MGKKRCPELNSVEYQRFIKHCVSLITCLSGCLPYDLPTIAQHFSAGVCGGETTSPEGTAEDSFVPAGLGWFDERQTQR